MMTDKKTGGITPQSAHKENTPLLKPQCQQVLDLLRQRPYSTQELRDLGIMAPASRVLELRAFGYPIITKRENLRKGTILHKNIAVYVLQRGK